MSRGTGSGLCALLLLVAASGCGVDANKNAAEPGQGADVQGTAAEDKASALEMSVEQLAQSESFVLAGVQLSSGERVHLQVRKGYIAGIESAERPPETAYFDASQLFVFPAFIDSHVHLSYFPRHEQLAQAGVFAAVDLAAPLESLSESSEFLHVLSAGPMLTSTGGYPTQSWGRDGYGLEVQGSTEAEQAVELLLEKGAKLIKLPLDGQNSLSDAEVEVIVTTAHRAGVKVAVHALSEAAAFRAASLNCDVLAHTPSETLSEQTVEMWKDKAVISTLGAFGAAESTVSNLRRLHEAGTRVLYGTDLGNSRLVGIDVQELRLLESAGLTRKEALAAGSTEAAAYWGLNLGLVQEGREASFLLLEQNPLEDLQTLQEARHLFFQGRLLLK